MKKKIILLFVGLFVILNLSIMFYVSDEPDSFKISKTNDVVVGSYTVSTTIHLTELLLTKKGGYISNDKMPPFVFLDNITNWEFGVLEILRLTTISLRKDLSRSQSQSVENKYLKVAQPKYSISSTSWLFPSAEQEYSSGKKDLLNYLKGIESTSEQDSQFFARADNLANLLDEYSKRLGSLSQRLSASIPSIRENTDLSNDENAAQSTYSGNKVIVETSFFKTDDVFYEAKGQTYAILHFLKAIEKDFDSVLKKKNAHASLKQIIRDLEYTQQEVWSPIILSGTGYGVITNHSLIISNYISRANVAIVDLVTLLKQG